MIVSATPTLIVKEGGKFTEGFLINKKGHAALKESSDFFPVTDTTKLQLAAVVIDPCK